jgi:Domain of unknown function (DUF4332)
MLDIPIQALPGLGDRDSAALINQQIATLSQLRAATRSPVEQRQLAQKLRIREQTLRKWLVLADLAQVPSVGTQYCGVLLHVGIVSVQSLARSQPPQLRSQVLRFQVAHLRRADLCPDLGQVERWIQDARAIVARARRA